MAYNGESLTLKCTPYSPGTPCRSGFPLGCLEIFAAVGVQLIRLRGAGQKGGAIRGVIDDQTLTRPQLSRVPQIVWRFPAPMSS